MTVRLSRPRRVAFAAALILACASSPALAAGVSVADANKEQKAQAGAAYKAGKAHLDGGRLEEALKGFRGSYDIVASPNSLFMVVRTLQDLGRLAEAYRTANDVVRVAEQAAAQSPKYAKTAAAAKDKMTELEALVGFLTVTVDSAPGWSLEINGMATPEEALADKVAVDPGMVEVKLTTTGGTETKQVEVAAGASATLMIAPPAPVVPDTVPDETPMEEPDDGEGIDGLRITSYVALGVGGAGMIMFGVFGGLTLGEFSTLEDECGGGTCSPEDSTRGDDGRTFQTVANVSLVIGAVGLAAGAGLLTYSLVQDDEGDDSASAAPQLIVGPGSVMVTGSF